MKLGPEQNVQMPMKTVISLIIMVSLGTMGYFQIQEKLNQHDTLLQMHSKDLDQNSEFRISFILQKDMEKVLSDIEKLKDKQRSFANGTNLP
jgi:hypothetical protein